MPFTDVCVCVYALFCPEILPAGAVKGLILVITASTQTLDNVTMTIL